MLNLSLSLPKSGLSGVDYTVWCWFGWVCWAYAAACDGCTGWVTCGDGYEGWTGG